MFGRTLEIPLAPAAGRRDPAVRTPCSTELLLVRPGQTTWNVQRRLQGQIDVPLGDAGVLEVARLAQRLLIEGGRLDAIVTSDLIRARRTAEILAATLGVVVEEDPRWRERDLGVFQGYTVEELRDAYPDEVARWESGEPEATPPGGEALDAYRARVASALGDLRARFPRGRVLVVAHGAGVREALAAAPGGAAPPQLCNASLSVLHADGDEWRWGLIDDASHLA